MLKKSLQSLNDTIDVMKTPIRVTLVVDGVRGGDKTLDASLKYVSLGLVDHLLVHHENMGLGPSINQSLSQVRDLNAWHKSRGEESKVSSFVSYCQDDLLYSSGWLEELIKWFTLFEGSKKLGFASGVECVEHRILQEENFGGRRILTKEWIRAANMFGRTDYWMSMHPIHGIDPETGRLRARPNDGMGSGVDWWFIRNHENSVCKTGRKCLVLPGLIRHAGYKDSTWLKRELPESEEDKAAIG
jgi:hypothetical protein